MQSQLWHIDDDDEDDEEVSTSAPQLPKQPEQQQQQHEEQMVGGDDDKVEILQLIFPNITRETIESVLNEQSDGDFNLALVLLSTDPAAAGGSSGNMASPMPASNHEKQQLPAFGGRALSNDPDLTDVRFLSRR